MKKANLCLAGENTATMESMENNAENENQQRSYWELEVPKNTNIGILMLSEGQVIVYYEGATGEVLDTKKKSFTPYSRLLPGSTVGINIWSIKES